MVNHCTLTKNPYRLKFGNTPRTVTQVLREDHSPKNLSRVPLMHIGCGRFARETLVRVFDATVVKEPG